MNSSPFFSVIIPNYNHAPYLHERIDSVLNQTFKDFEVILLDDKSQDDSCEILRSYENNPHVAHVVLNNQNSGSTFKQWHKGFDLARGIYIWIAESDDFADKRFLQVAYDIIQKEDNVTLAYFKSNIVNSDSKITHRHEPASGGAYSVWQGNMFIKENMLRGNSIVNASSAVFKKSSIPKDDSYTKYKYCGDWLFWSMMASAGNVVRINEYYNYFRMHQVKVTPKAMAGGLSYIEGSQILPMLAQLAGLSRMKIILIESLRYCDMLMDIYIPSVNKRSISKKIQVSNPLVKTIGELLYFLKRIRRK